MQKICITGSIGSGKTTVANIFKAIGIPVYNADEKAKELYAEETVKTLLLKNFGETIFDSDKNINKEILASIVFNNPDALKKINSIIHPLVMENFHNWNKQQSSNSYVIFESAIIFESGLDKKFDKIISVSAPEDLRIKRVMKRDSVNSDKVLQRIKNQWSNEAKVKLSDFVIINDERQLLIPQILEIHKKISPEKN